jgi:hypothetical protein
VLLIEYREENQLQNQTSIFGRQIIPSNFVFSFCAFAGQGCDCRHTYEMHVDHLVKWSLKCFHLNENCNGSTILVKMSSISVIKKLLFFSSYIHAASNFSMSSAIQGCECAYSGTLGQLACAHTPVQYSVTQIKENFFSIHLKNMGHLINAQDHNILHTYIPET